MSDQEKLRLVVDGSLTYEQLRSLRAIQVASAQKYEQSRGLASVAEEDSVAFGVRPYDQRPRGRDRIVIGSCFALWLGLIIIGTLTAPPVHHHDASRRSSAMHRPHSDASAAAAVTGILNATESWGSNLTTTENGNAIQH